MEAELKAMTADLRLQKCVRFVGYVPHNKLMELYHSGKIDLLVLPSVSLLHNCHEGIPVSLMEAMACGIPVLSTTTGGIPELLHDGAGVMVPPQDAGGLADALERLIRDPDLRRRLAVAGRRRVEEEFNVRVTTSQLADRIRAAGPRRQKLQTMNILLINHYAGSHHHGMEYRPFCLGREWVKLGHQVTVVAASHSHLRIQQPIGRRQFCRRVAGRMRSCG